MSQWSKRAILMWLVQRSEDEMAAIDGLRASVSDLKAAADAEHAELSSVVTELGTVEAQLTDLQGKVAAGGGVTEAELADVTQSITAVSQAAKSAVESAKTDPAVVSGEQPSPATPATAPEPTGGTPADPAVAVAPAADSGDAPASPAVDPNTPVPEGAPTDPTTTAPTGVSVDERTVYTTSLDPTLISTATWPLAPVQTDETPPRQLYYFAGDQVSGEANGANVAGWEQYGGATQPTVAAQAAQPAQENAEAQSETPEG